MRGCFTALRFVQHDKLRMANLTLLSLSFNKERDVCASRQGEVNPAWVIMPILAIIGLVLNGLGLIALLAVGIIAIFALTAGVQVLLGFVFTVATVVLLALALPGLFARKRAGWVWIYYAELLSIVSSIISLSIFGVLFSLLWLYVLFQIRGMYAE